MTDAPNIPESIVIAPQRTNIIATAPAYWPRVSRMAIVVLAYVPFHSCLLTSIDTSFFCPHSTTLSKFHSCRHIEAVATNTNYRFCHIFYRFP